MPREHGAWGILLIPFATAVGVSGVFDLKVALLLGSVLCFYVARTSYLKQNVKWTAILLAGSVGCVAPLFVVWKLWWLAAFGAVAAVLAIRQTERNTLVQLLAVCGLTLTAPATWYVATGKLDTQAFWLWLLNALFFAGGVFYVKMHIAAAIRRRPFENLTERFRFGAMPLMFYAALSVLLVVLAVRNVIPYLSLLAFTPVVARTVIGVGRLSPTLRIKRLAWTEVANSIVYAVVLTVTLRIR